MGVGRRCYAGPMSSTSLQGPKGTRDLYPADLLRRRYIERAWRETSIRHGFEEIDGPTFEHRELYERKSGEGILGEMFGVFSGKDEAEVRSLRESGVAPFALRPEFTPTLARMYAAKAGGLPRPCKWFWQQMCYRAEKPQRGRLREFMQWNCDIVGVGGGGEDSAGAEASADAEIIAVCVGLLRSLGLTPKDVVVRYNHRATLWGIVSACGVGAAHAEAALVLLDRREKLSDADLEARAFEFGLGRGDYPVFHEFLTRPRGRRSLAEELASLPGEASSRVGDAAGAPLARLEAELARAGVSEWCVFDLNIARGLAYYTGMVFEVHEVSGAERAIAGGGRYDKLIELFGGPPTPAVGFGMGDVVLSNVLGDRGLLPEGVGLMEALSGGGVSMRPEVFVLSNGTPEAEAVVKPLVARLRESSVHARHSYKSTKNIGKLLQEASGCLARYAAIVESAEEVTLKNLDTQAQRRVPMGEVGSAVASRSV